MFEAARETGDALCGGFMSWQTLQSLDSLGLEKGALAGQVISRLRLFAGQQKAEALLPAPAIGLSRRLLDSMLTDIAVSQGVGLERGASVIELCEDGSLRLKDGSRCEADCLFIATGKHDLRGLGRTRSRSQTLGLRLRLPPHPRLTSLVSDAIELHLFEGGYAGLVQQEDGSANLCMAVRKSKLTQASGNPLRLLEQIAEHNPYLSDRLSFIGVDPAIESIAAIPYGWIGRETVAGQFRLGDQAACIPSLAGEGIGLALASGKRAAEAFLIGGRESAPRFQREFAASARRPVMIAKWLWHMAEHPVLAPAILGATTLSPALTRFAAHLTRIGD